jgi:hypothetical protein
MTKADLLAELAALPDDTIIGVAVRDADNGEWVCSLQKGAPDPDCDDGAVYNLRAILGA